MLYWRPKIKNSAESHLTPITLLIIIAISDREGKAWLKEFIEERRSNAKWCLRS